MAKMTSRKGIKTAVKVPAPKAARGGILTGPGQQAAMKRLTGQGAIGGRKGTKLGTGGSKPRGGGGGGGGGKLGPGSKRQKAVGAGLIGQIAG